MADQILVEQSGSILRIGINRPEKKNALTIAMYAAMTDALHAAESDPAIRVILIHGTSDCFTSGNDIMDFVQAPPTDETSPVFRFLHAIVGATKPLVAAVAGPAVGIGTTMLLHCDLVFAVQQTRFQLPFINLGLVPEAGSSLLLPRFLGHVRAAELLMLGEPFDGATALELGLVNQVVPNEEVIAVATDAARALAAKPPAAMRATKALLKQGVRDAVEATIATEGKLFAERLQSPEAGEAFQAFMERRRPDFSQFQ